MFALPSLGRSFHRRALAFWTRAADDAHRTPVEDLSQRQEEAAALQARLSDFRHRADERLLHPRVGSDRIAAPGGSDWSWRPEAWRVPIGRRGIVAMDTRTELDPQLTMFHDCDISELSVRQVRNRDDSDLAPFGLRMDVFRFDGTFLSLVLDLPEAATDGLLQRHIVRLTLRIELERRAEVFARLNIKHGPNTEKMLREIPDPNGDVVVEFDLAYTEMNERRVESAWLDLIFEGVEMNQIALRDVALCRYPRAEI